MSYRRARVKAIERDRGCCRLCGIDCQLATRIVVRLTALRPTGNGAVYYGLRQYLLLIGWKRKHSAFLEVDHILPRAAGGQDNLGNLRVLCQRCHETETARFASRRAAGRKTLNRDQYPTRKLSGKIKSRGFPKGKRLLPARRNPWPRRN